MTLLTEIVWGNWLDALQTLGLLVLSGALGGLIGAEREWRGKPAGLRTHIFIAIASTVFMLLGQSVVTRFGDPAAADSVAADPTRVMHAVIVGISFIGAGTIIQRGTTMVAGLTTAASIWLVAAIGIAVAVGQWPLAVMVTILALIVLVALGAVERRLGKPFDQPK